MEEVFKPIIGYEEFYEVSNLGRVRSLIKGMMMKPITHCTGYCIIGLVKNKKQKTFRLHRIVAEHFCKKNENCNVVNHINGVKNDNSSENLEWTTVSGNTLHSFRMGLQKTRVGEDCNFCLLSTAQVLKIRELYGAGQHTQKQISLLYNISRESVSVIVNRKRWKHI